MVGADEVATKAIVEGSKVQGVKSPRSFPSTFENPSTWRVAELRSAGTGKYHWASSPRFGGASCAVTVPAAVVSVAPVGGIASGVSTPANS